MSFENPSRLEKLAFRVEWSYSGRLIRPYLRGLPLRGDEVLLEIGCGGGAVTRELARLLPRGRVIGIDPSSYWVEYARTRLQDPRDIVLLDDDVLTVDLATESIDAALLHYVLHEIPADERPSTLDRIYELLKAEGKLFVREPTKPKHGMSPDEIRELADSVGLREEHGRTRRSLLRGTAFEAVFRKA